MRLEWDGRKNRGNIRKHGFDFIDAWEVFHNPLIPRLDTREEYGEARWEAIGMLRGRVVVLVFTEPRPDTIRIISLRKANKDERKAHEEALKN